MNFLQSEQWLKTKQELGNKTFEVGEYFFQTTKIPYLNKYIGYMPRVDLNKLNTEELSSKAKSENCVFVTIDPENLKTDLDSLSFFKNKGINAELGLPIHLQNTVIIDLKKSEENFLSGMKQKTRYNLKLAQKKGVKVVISNEESELALFVDLYLKTIKRQGYSGRSSNYLKTVWNNFKGNVFIATAYFENTPLASWFVIAYEDTLTYVYGGSSDEHKNLMAPYLLVWELSKYGKEKGFKYLDLFGIKKDLSDGYSRFKAGFGGEIVEFSDTVDIVLDSKMYSIIKFAYKLRNIVKF